MILTFPFGTERTLNSIWALDLYGWPLAPCGWPVVPCGRPVEPRGGRIFVNNIRLTFNSQRMNLETKLSFVELWQTFELVWDFYFHFLSTSVGYRKPLLVFGGTDCRLHSLNQGSFGSLEMNARRMICKGRWWRNVSLVTWPAVEINIWPNSVCPTSLWLA